MKLASATVALIIPILGLSTIPARAHDPKTYSQILCKDHRFTCYKVKKGDTWEKLFPNWNERNIAKRVNRMNIPLKPGMVLAIPEDITGKTAEDFSPFPKRLSWVTEKTVIFSLGALYFAAYEETGRRLITGPISAGRGCPGKDCLTPTGIFRFYQKFGADKISDLYPIKSWKTVVGENGKETKVPDERGGAKVPWFMAIVGDVGAHGYSVLPGYNASNGCLRQFFADAQWLNQEFVDVSPGTLVIIMNGIPDPNAKPPH